MPVPAEGADRLALFAPDTVFLNAAARQAWPAAQQAAAASAACSCATLRVAGSVAAGGGAAGGDGHRARRRTCSGARGQLTRIDVRLRARRRRAPPSCARCNCRAGVQRGRARRRRRSASSNLSRAYRVNLTVLALVALFTGAFLVFSVLALSVARRAQQFALLGVLGLTARAAAAAGAGRVRAARRRAAASLGIALGTALAALALRLLGGDLGGGYFPGVAPRLQWSSAAALVYGALGVVAALAGGWLPARAAQRAAAGADAQGPGRGRCRAGAQPRSACC